MIQRSITDLTSAQRFSHHQPIAQPLHVFSQAETNLRFERNSATMRRRKWIRNNNFVLQTCILCFMWSFLHRRVLCTAFLPRSVAPQRIRTLAPFSNLRLTPYHMGNYRKVSQPLYLAVAKKSTYTRKQSLVVHGPPGFSEHGDWERPFKLVIVESPSKCQTIAKILKEYVEDQKLDHDYVVTSCMGHIRNIPQKKTHKNQVIAGIDLEHGRYEPTYTILPEKQQLVEDLKALTGQCQQLILATDDDREGEAMAWHLLQVLKENEVSTTTTATTEQLPPIRVRFTEITPKAITESIFNSTSTNLNDNLVQAQETRRILDRLAGFTVSPILWKKIAPGLSAGRVQSVGMALIVQRERERLLFQETEYWCVRAKFAHKTDTFEGTLVSINGETLASSGGDFDPRQSGVLVEASKHKLHFKEKDATDLIQRLESEEWEWSVSSVKQKQRKLNPPAPFITSSLQQEANKRLGLAVSQTMRTAQQLYEKGYISYMRTDSKHLSEDAVGAIQTEIIQDYGGPENFQMIPNQRASKKTKKDKPEAQAAHEAIRPAIQANGRFAKPDSLPSNFDGVSHELYKLIYQRTVASHMPPQVSNQTTIGIMGENEDTSLVFLTSGSVVIKPGYTLAYPRQSESKSSELPNLREGDQVWHDNSSPLHHTSQPPARFTEASFVEELERLGVGRPSTYAGTVQILRDRAYVGSPTRSDNASRSSGKAVTGPAISAQRAAGGDEFVGSRSARGTMVPSLTAFVVCSLFEKYCNMYVDPTFTAQMEERLDAIANAEETVGEAERVAYLDEFYAGESGLAAKIENINQMVEADDARRATLPSLTSQDNDIGLFVGPWGPYVKKIEPIHTNGDPSEQKPVVAQLPAGMASDLSTITLKSLENLLATKESNGALIGQHPDDGRSIRVKVGRYGAFLQWGEDDEEGTTTHTLPASVRSMKNIDASSDGTLTSMLGITFDEAIQYVNLPRTVCTMDDRPIIAAIGPYGPYLKYNNTFVSLKPGDGDVLTISPEDAVHIVKEGLQNKSKLGADVLAEIGEKDGSKVTVKNGRFGSYINWKRVNAKLPSEYVDNPSDLPLNEAWSLIQEKAGATATVGKARKGGKQKSQDVDLPPAPKRPPSAYLHFCAKKRSEVAETATSLGAISKELARLWAETSDDDRLEYQELAETSKKEYEEKKKVWEAECQALLSKAGTKTAKPSNAPKDTIKRPRSSYLFFCSEKRPEVAAKFTKLGDVSKELARLWAATTADERQVYEKLAVDDKARYENEKLAANGSAPKKSGQIDTKATTKKKRGPSAYMLFCAANRQSIVDEKGNKLPLGETTKRLAQMWNECDETTRREFMAEAERQKEALA